jgi:alkylation response protein AidB-like acyl-CoA dehydrogenase
MISCDYVPAYEPKEMLDDPAIAPMILRHVITWLREHATGLESLEQRDLAREAARRAGIYAAEYPEEVGGYSLSERVMAELREEAAATGLWYSRLLLSDSDGPSRILMDGTPEQRQRWLRPLIEARWSRCLAMTEETGGSDLSALRTTANRTDGGWELTGRKFLISNAAYADVAIVLANARGGKTTGPTFFVFATEGTPGWNVLRRLPGMDPNYHTFEVELDGIRVGDDAVVGGIGQVGTGIGRASEGMAYGRLAVAARAAGLSRYALGVARRYAATRKIGGGRLDDKQYIREFLVRSDVKVEAARALVRQAADALDDGYAAVREAAVAKLFATESACQVIDDAMQVLGGRGWLEEFGLESIYREARTFRIADGASELLKETIFYLPPSAASDGSRV